MRSRIFFLSIAFGAAFISSAASAGKHCTRLPLSYLAADEAAATAGARQKLKQYAIEKLTERGWSGKGRLRKIDEVVTCKPYLSIGPIATGHRCRVTATFCASAEPVIQARTTTKTQAKAIKRPAPDHIQVAAPRPVQRATPARQAAPILRPGQAAPVRRPHSAAAPQQRRRQSATPSKPHPRRAGERVVKLRLKGSNYHISGVLKHYNKVSYVIAPPDSQNITVPADRFDCVAGACPNRPN